MAAAAAAEAAATAAEAEAEAEARAGAEAEAEAMAEPFSLAAQTHSARKSSRTSAVLHASKHKATNYYVCNVCSGGGGGCSNDYACAS